MQIDPIRLTHLKGADQAAPAKEAAAVTGAEGAGEATPATQAQATNGVVLSQQASEVRAAHEALAATPDTRAELVAKLKAQVEAGTYAADADAVAEKMVPE